MKKLIIIILICVCLGCAAQTAQVQTGEPPTMANQTVEQNVGDVVNTVTTGVNVVTTVRDVFWLFSLF